MKRFLTLSAGIAIGLASPVLAQTRADILPDDARLENRIAPIIAKYTNAPLPAEPGLRDSIVFADPVTALVPRSDSLDLPAEWLSGREQFAVLFGRDWKGFNGESWGRDTLLFVPLASAMPEPETWISLIVGFGLVGGALRRGRATRVAAQQA